MTFKEKEMEYAVRTAQAYYKHHLGAFMSKADTFENSDLWKRANGTDDDKPVKKDYDTVGVRFLAGPNLQKVYTYRVKKGAKLRLGQEVVVPTQREVLSNSVAVVVELHKTPQDTGSYDYKFVAGTVQFL